MECKLISNGSTITYLENENVLFNFDLKPLGVRCNDDIRGYLKPFYNRGSFTVPRREESDPNIAPSCYNFFHFKAINFFTYGLEVYVSTQEGLYIHITDNYNFEAYSRSAVNGMRSKLLDCNYQTGKLEPISIKEIEAYNESMSQLFQQWKERLKERLNLPEIDPPSNFLATVE